MCVRLCYASIMPPRVHSSVLNVKEISPRSQSASAHATRYVLNATLHDAYLNLSFLAAINYVECAPFYRAPDEEN